MSAMAEARGKDLAFVMAGKFLRNMRTEGRVIAPTAEELTAVAERLRGRLKRKKGVTPERELKRRIQAKGVFSRKWQVARKESQKYRIRIWLIDQAANSQKVDSEFKVSEKAARKTGTEFKQRLDMMADQITRI